MLAGDVALNPGPAYQPKYPCQVCTKAAKWGQECLQCDCCQQWYHVHCLSIDRNIVNIFEQHSSYTWICCTCGMPNFDTSYFGSLNKFSDSNIFDSLSSISIDSLPPDMLLGKPLNSSSPSKHAAENAQSKAKVGKSARKPKERPLKFVNVNCQSVRAKLPGFQHLLQAEDPDVVVGTESWLHENIPTGEIFPSTFQVFRKDRIGDAHGGVFIAVRST